MAFSHRNPNLGSRGGCPDLISLLGAKCCVCVRLQRVCCSQLSLHSSNRGLTLWEFTSCAALASLRSSAHCQTWITWLLFCPFGVLLFVFVAVGLLIAYGWVAGHMCSVVSCLPLSCDASRSFGFAHTMSPTAFGLMASERPMHPPLACRSSVLNEAAILGMVRSPFAGQPGMVGAFSFFGRGIAACGQLSGEGLYVPSA